MSNINRQPERRSGGGAYYPGKVPRPRTFQMTPLGNDLLDVALSRTGRSIGDVFERLLRKHWPDIEFDDDSSAEAESIAEAEQVAAQV